MAISAFEKFQSRFVRHAAAGARGVFGGPVSSGPVDVRVARSLLENRWRERVVELARAGLSSRVPKLARTANCNSELGDSIRWRCGFFLCPWCWAHRNAIAGKSLLDVILTPQIVPPPPPSPQPYVRGQQPEQYRRIRLPPTAPVVPVAPVVVSSLARDLIVRHISYSSPLADRRGLPYLRSFIVKRVARRGTAGAGGWNRVNEWRQFQRHGATGGYEFLVPSPIGISPSQANAGWLFGITQLILTPRGESGGLLSRIGKEHQQASAVVCDVVASDVPGEYLTRIARALAYPGWFMTASPEFVELFLEARAPQDDEPAKIRMAATFGELRSQP